MSSMPLFVDMDGVACDFNKEASRMVGRSYEELTSHEKIDFWHYTLTPEFFERLEPAPFLDEFLDGAMDFFDGDVRFLTALPLNRKDLAYQSAACKMNWVRRNCKRDIPVTFGPFAIDKQRHCLGKTYSLLDDNKKNVAQWQARGGIAVHHKGIDTLLDSLILLTT